VITSTGKGTATATCPAGTFLLGGGGTALAVNNATAITSLYQSYPSAPDTWTVSSNLFRTIAGSQTMQTQAYVVCTS